MGSSDSKPRYISVQQEYPVEKVERLSLNDDTDTIITKKSDGENILKPLPTLDDDSLAIIQRYRRILEACQRREYILKHATLAYVWSPRITKNYKDSFMDLIVKVPSDSAIPFHNQYPWEIFSFNGIDVRIGMWEDRYNLIYLVGEDVQSWEHMRNISIGTKLFLNDDIKCKRIKYKSEWVMCN